MWDLRWSTGEGTRRGCGQDLSVEVCVVAVVQLEQVGWVVVVTTYPSLDSHWEEN